MTGAMSNSAEAYRQIALDLACVEASHDGPLGLHVTGYSMIPLLRPGDVVMAQPVEWHRLCRGDLVVVRRPDDVITHRLVAVGEQDYLTKGDNCCSADAPVSPAAILGRVVAIERGNVRVDLQGRRWTWVNRWLGKVGWWEVCAARRIGPALKRPIHLFFRALTRLMLFLPLGV